MYCENCWFSFEQVQIFAEFVEKVRMSLFLGIDLYTLSKYFTEISQGFLAKVQYLFKADKKQNPSLCS